MTAFEHFRHRIDEADVHLIKTASRNTKHVFASILLSTIAGSCETCGSVYGRSICSLRSLPKSRPALSGVSGQNSHPDHRPGVKPGVSGGVVLVTSSNTVLLSTHSASSPSPAPFIWLSTSCRHGMQSDPCVNALYILNSAGVVRLTKYRVRSYLGVSQLIAFTRCICACSSGRVCASAEFCFVSSSLLVLCRGREKCVTP